MSDAASQTCTALSVVGVLLELHCSAACGEVAVGAAVTQGSALGRWGWSWLALACSILESGGAHP